MSKSESKNEGKHAKLGHQIIKPCWNGPRFDTVEHNGIENKHIPRFRVLGVW